MLTQEQIKANIDALQKQGASKEQIQGWLDSMKGKVAPAGETQKPGFLQGLAQEVARPFLKVPASFASAAASAISPEAGRRAREEGVPFGYLGKVKPFGAYEGELPTGGDALRAGADVAGSALEVASYAMAPLKIGGGFWNTVKEVAPLAITFGTGKGLQATGEGKGAMESVVTGAGNAVGAAAGYGLFKGGANLFANWGARALQSDAVRVTGQEMKNLAEYTWNSLPEAFQKGVTSLTDFTNATTRRTVAALRSQFDTNYNTAKDAVIDGLMPSVNQPDLVFSKFQRNLSESMGNMFRKSNTLYDDVKADATTIGRFTRAEEALGKLPKVPEFPSKLPASATAEEKAAQLSAYKASQKASESSSETMQQFAEDVGSAVKQPLTLKQIMALWSDAMSYLPKATNEEKVIIRDFASGLYADARSVLEKGNKGLLNQWDMAWQSWKTAVDRYTSGPLNVFKSSGDVDTVVDKMLRKDMTREDRAKISEAISEDPMGVLDLFENSLLRKAKEARPNGGASILKEFLDGDLPSWERLFVNAVKDDPVLTEQVTGRMKKLDDIASFLSGSFDEFVLGMRQAQGLTDEMATELFHGTKAPISSLKQADVLQYGNPGALYGPGLYLTDSTDIAGGYAISKGAGDTGKVLSAYLAPGTKLLNLDNPLTTKEAEVFSNFVNMAKGDLEKGTINFEGKTVGEAMRAIMLDLEEARIPKYEAGDMLNTLQDSLKEKFGYDGFQHVGGGITGGKSHNVTILFDNGNSSAASKLVDKPITAASLMEQQTHLDLLKTVNDGRLDEIAGRFIKMADSPELVKTLAAFSPDEKNVIGMSIAKGMFDEKLPVAALNPDGTYKIAPEFATTLIETSQKVAENKALQQILSPDQLTALKQAADFAMKMEDTSQVPAAGFHRLMNGLISVFYFARGWMPGGIRNAIEAASGAGEKTLLYYDAVGQLIEQGFLKKNVPIRIGDLIKAILPGVGQVSTEALGEAME